MLPLVGRHQVANALAALAVAREWGLDRAAVVAALGTASAGAGRMEVRELHGATLLVDCYNANPDSTRAAIAVLAGMTGTKLLVLGDMGELGTQSAELHAEVGALARASGIDRLFTFGEFSAHASRAFDANARHFQHIEDLLAEIENMLAPGVTVLVKGSRFMRMERVVKSFEVKSEESGLRS
jgi:UDP-N-acetylmuramoyl-tripeptide--D-alanyl-D-alanine ligase